MGEITEIEGQNFINNIFSNAVLIAVDRRLDLSQIVPFIDGSMEKFKETEKEFAGLLFVDLLAKEMGVAVEDLLNTDMNKKAELIKSIIAALSMDGVVLDFAGPDAGEESSYITYVLSDLKAFDKTATFVEMPEELVGEALEKEKNDYLVELEAKDGEYSMSILTNNITDSKYFRNQIKVWREKEGFLSEYIEEAFEENTVFAFKEGVSEDELVACVFEDTRTVKLLDRFEGFGENNDKSYQRLIIKNGMLFCNYGDPYINLVIERRTSNDVKGDITFTEYKQGNISGIRQHIIEELDHSIIEAYLDKNQFYRFSTGYLLRAQNSKNRSGYGWEWNWKNGVGTYKKGTEYGETTDYVFVGAYISSTYIFDATKREDMLQLCEPVVVNSPKENAIEHLAIEEEVKIEKTKEASSNDMESAMNAISFEKQEIKHEEPPIYDVEKLRQAKDKQAIVVGSYVEYKKLYLNEMVETVIDDKKLLHKKLIGKMQGDIVTDGSKRYLITKVQND